MTNLLEYQEHIDALLQTIIRKHDAGEAVAAAWVRANLIAAMDNSAVETVCASLGIDLRKRRFRFLKPSEVIGRSMPKWLIEDLLVEKTFTIIYAQSQSLKTYWDVNLLGHLATGGQFSPGNVLPQTGVLHIVLEGGFGMGTRLQAWAIHHGRAWPEDHYRQMEDGLSFSDPQCVEDLFADMHALIDGGFPLGFVNIDTAAKALGAFDGMSQKDVIAFCAVCTRMVKEFGVGVLLVHHTGKNEQGGIIGSNSWLTEPDCVLYVNRKDKTSPHVTVTVEKQKYGPAGQTHPFIAVEVALSGVQPGGVASDLVLVPDLNAPSQTAAKAAQQAQADLLEIALLVDPGTRKSIRQVCLASAQAKGAFSRNGRDSKRVIELLREERHVRINGSEIRRLWLDKEGKICCETMGQV